MVAVQLVGSYCLPSLLYGCEVWQTRADDVRSASVAWNNCFREICNACWRESVRPLLFFCSYLPLTYIIHQQRLLYWKKCLFSDNVLLQTLARSLYIYKLTIKNLVDLPKHLVKELFQKEFERLHILWQCIVFLSSDLCLIVCFDFMFFCVTVLLRRNKRWNQMDG